MSLLQLVAVISMAIILFIGVGLYLFYLWDKKKYPQAHLDKQKKKKRYPESEEY